MGLVVPAVLPSSREDLERKIALLARIPSIFRIQIDVVDGRFASPASWPYSDSEELKSLSTLREMLLALDRLEYEIDLMCLDPEQAAGAWLTLGATRLTFHAESALNLSRLLSSSRSRYGEFISFGLALNIESDIALIEPCLGAVEYIQFMGIARIGKQGQPFDRRVLEKIRTFHIRYPDILIQVDGGVSLESAPQLLTLGVSNLVIGSNILKTKDPSLAFAAFEELQSPFGI